MVSVDARPDLETFGQHVALVLDDTEFTAVYIPAGFLHGFQVISRTPADVVYRFDRPHERSEYVAVHYDDPDLGIHGHPGRPILGAGDATAGSWADFVAAGHAGRSSASSLPDS